MDNQRLHDINAAYECLEIKHAELISALFHRMWKLESGWYNGHYHKGMSISEMKEKIRASAETEIGFSFVFPFDQAGAELFEFVKLLRRENFYY